jgi:DNA-binding MarR family transcriptional regulator
MNDLLQPVHCVSSNLHQTARAVSRIYGEEMRPSGIRRSQFGILGYLQKLGTVQLTVLANTLYMERTTLTRNLKPLEKSGLVQIKKSVTDARVRDVTITKAGKAKFREASRLWRKAQKRILLRFGEENWAALEIDLQKLRSQID